MNKKIIFTILTAFALFILIINPVFANYEVEVGIPGYDKDLPYEEAGSQLSAYLEALFIFLISIVGITGMFFIIYGGFAYMMSGGNASKTGEAKDRIIAAISGLILVLCSVLVLEFISPELAPPTLPGLEGINASGWNWGDYLPDPPKSGDGERNLPDGTFCSSYLDCNYTRICAKNFFCPKDPLKQRFSSAPECYTANTDLCDETNITDMPECTQENTCKPIFDQDGYIFNPETKAKTDLIAYGFKCKKEQEDDNKKCFDNVGSASLGISPEIAPNLNIICNRGNNPPVCKKKSVYWEPCHDTTDCEGDLKCDESLEDQSTSKGLCNTENGMPPPPDEPENGEKPSVHGDKNLFLSIESYNDKYYAIAAYEHQWSGTQKCEKLGKWEKAEKNHLYKKTVCQNRWANQPKTKTNKEIIICDGKEKCTSYRWSETRKTSETIQQSCKNDWKKKSASDCLEAGLNQPPIDEQFCCTYDIVCCENKSSRNNKALCERIKGYQWKEASKNTCFNNLDIFDQDSWIVKWRTNNMNADEFEALPGACCEREETEDEKDREDEEDRDWEDI